MNEVKNSNYYIAQAERCLRWSRLLSDKRSIVELEKMAEEYMHLAERQRSLETATYKERDRAFV